MWLALKLGMDIQESIPCIAGVCQKEIDAPKHQQRETRMLSPSLDTVQEEAESAAPCAKERQKSREAEVPYQEARIGAGFPKCPPGQQKPPESSPGLADMGFKDLSVWATVSDCGAGDSAAQLHAS